MSSRRPLLRDELAVFNLVAGPVWLYSCASQRLVWGNKSCLSYFNKNMDAFVSFRFLRLPAEDQATFAIHNTLIRDEVEDGGSEAVVPGFGHAVLPGVIPHEQLGSSEFLYKQLLLSTPGSEGKAYTQIQVVRSPLISVPAPRCFAVQGAPRQSCETSRSALGKPVPSLLNVCDSILRGREVDLDQVEALHRSLLRGEISLQPSRIADELAKDELDRDVGLSLLQLLGGQQHGVKVLTDMSAADTQQQQQLPEQDAVCLIEGPHAGRQSGSGGISLNKTNGRVSSSTGHHTLPIHHAPNGTVHKTVVQKQREGADGSSSIIAASLVPAMEAALSTVDDWRFDAFKLAEATQGHPLSALCFWLFKRYDIINTYQLDAIKLARFLRRIEDGYPDNPYHNKIHAADVLHGMHCLLTHGGLHKRLGEDLAMFAGYLAAVLHDHEHRGLNNDFLVRVCDDLAVTYNDISPMENHHVSSAFKLLKHQDYNFLKRLPRDRWVRLRRLLIDMVLATDMKQHFNVLSKFQAKLQVKLRSQHFSPTPGHLEDRRDDDLSLPLAEDDADRSLILQVGLKCADVGHLAAQWDVHHQWVSGLEEEFFKQGDREKALHMTASPLMDRSKDGITKSQVGFFDIVALPLFYSWASVFPDALPLVRAVEENCNRWRTLEVGRVSGLTSK